MPGGTRTPPGIAGWQGLGCLLHLSGCCLSFPRKKDGGKDALSQLRNPPLWMVGRGHGAIKRPGGSEVGEREGVQEVQGDSPGVGMDLGSAWQQGWGPPQIRSSHPLSCRVFPAPSYKPVSGLSPPRSLFKIFWAGSTLIWDTIPRDKTPDCCKETDSGGNLRFFGSQFPL